MKALFFPVLPQDVSGIIILLFFQTAFYLNLILSTWLNLASLKKQTFNLIPARHYTCTKNAVLTVALLVKEQFCHCLEVVLPNQGRYICSLLHACCSTQAQKAATAMQCAVKKGKPGLQRTTTCQVTGQGHASHVLSILCVPFPSDSFHPTRCSMGPCTRCSISVHPMCHPAGKWVQYPKHRALWFITTALRALPFSRGWNRTFSFEILRGYSNYI